MSLPTAAVWSRGVVLVKDGNVGFALEIEPNEAEAMAKEPLRLACEEAVMALPGVTSVTAVLTAHNERAVRAAGPGGATRRWRPSAGQWPWRRAAAAGNRSCGSRW